MALGSLANLKTALNIAAADTSRDSQLTQILTAADAAIKQYCDRDFEQTTYPGTATGGRGDSGFYSGTNRPELILRQTPVTAVSSIYLDATGYWGQGTNAFASGTLLTSGTDYVIDYDGYIGAASASYSGIVRRIGGGAGTSGYYGWYPPGYGGGGSLVRPYRDPVWPHGQGNIKVAYTAGYATIPTDLAEAVYNLAQWLSITIQRGGMIPQSESLADYSYTLMMRTLTDAPELGTTRQLLGKYKRLVV